MAFISYTTRGDVTTITYSPDHFRINEPMIDGYKLSEHPRRDGIEAAIRYLKGRNTK